MCVTPVNLSSHPAGNNPTRMFTRSVSLASRSKQIARRPHAVKNDSAVLFTRSEAGENRSEPISLCSVPLEKRSGPISLCSDARENRSGTLAIRSGCMDIPYSRIKFRSSRRQIELTDFNTS